MPDGQPASWSAPAPATSSPLERLYDAVAAPLYRFFYHQVGNREEAEDLTSEVFLKAARLLDTSRDEAAQRAWLRQVARTALADYWRRFYRAQSPLLLPASPPDEIGDDPSSDAHAPRLSEVLARLPENYQRVLKLRFLEGCSVQETAVALGLSQANVKVLQYRAVRRAAELGLAAEPAERRGADD